MYLAARSLDQRQLRDAVRRRRLGIGKDSLGSAGHHGSHSIVLISTSGPAGGPRFIQALDRGAGMVGAMAFEVEVVRVHHARPGGKRGVHQRLAFTLVSMTDMPRTTAVRCSPQRPAMSQKRGKRHSCWRLHAPCRSVPLLPCTCESSVAVRSCRLE